MAVLGRNSDNVRIFGGLEDQVWAAPVGRQVLPLGLEVLGGLWVPFGWLSEDGIAYEPSTEAEKITAHQGGATVRVKSVRTEKTLGFTALESHPLSRLAFDGAKPPKLTATGSKVARMDLPENIGVTEFALVVDTFDDAPTGLVHERFCIERWAVSERGSAQSTNSAVRGFELTGDVLGKSYILTDAASFVEAAGTSVYTP